MIKLNEKEYREYCWLLEEWDAVCCSCCPQYKLADWKQERLEKLDERYRKFGTYKNDSQRKN